MLGFDTRGEGTPIVLLHGLTFDRSVWRPVAEGLGDGVRSVAIDLPGHGESPAFPGSVPEAIDELGDTLDQLGIVEPILVGHSVSAILSLLIAAGRPVRGVVDVDQPLDPSGFAEFLQRIAPELRGDGFLPAVRSIFAGLGIERLPPSAREHVERIQRIDRDVVLGYWETLLSTDPAVLRANNARLMAALGAPFLGIFGNELDPGNRAYLTENLRDVTIETWGGDDGHLFFMAAPDRFAAKLLAFAERVGVS